MKVALPGGVQRRGGNEGDGPGHLKLGGHPKSGTAKMKMLQQDDFPIVRR